MSSIPEGPKTLLVDLRGCQVHADRGIPAYAQSLVQHLAERHPGHRFLWMIDPGRPMPARQEQLARLGRFRTERDLASDRSLQVDVLLSTWLFLPPGEAGPVELVPTWLQAHAPLRLGIVYDLIPYLFPDRYLARAEDRSLFLSGFREMRSYDRLFAISEATRQDVIRLGGVAPHKVVTLPGDLDAAKRQALSAPGAPRVPQDALLDGDYFIYVGGEDWRKNLGGLVRGYARFRADRPAGSGSPRLAIVCRISDGGRQELMALAASLGLPEGAVVCTGLVDDDRFIALMRGARGMVFPSFYEGLGLPILEAYACGIPVLGSDNSSIRELVAPPCRFDPSDPQAIAAAMAGLCDDRSVAPASLSHGRRVLSGLSWPVSADRVAEAFAPTGPLPARAFRRPSVAVIGVLPPQDTGIAPYTLRHLQSEAWRTDFFSRETPEASALLPGNRVLPPEILPHALQGAPYQEEVYVLGNSRHHGHVLEALLATRTGSGARRWAYLHEADAWAPLSTHLGRAATLLLPEKPEPVPAGAPAWIQRALRAFPGLRPALRFLRRKGGLHGLLVNSTACKELVRHALGQEAEGWEIRTLFLPVAPPAATPRGSSPGELKVGFFGVPAENKQPGKVVEAFEILRRTHPARLLLAGWGVSGFAETRRLQGREDITCLESPSDADLFDAMAGVDVAVQLRVPSIGESSGVVGQLLALGKPVVVTGEGSYADLEDAWVAKVAADIDPAALAQQILAASQRDMAGMADRFMAAYSAGAFQSAFADLLGIPRSG